MSWCNRCPEGHPMSCDDGDCPMCALMRGDTAGDVIADANWLEAHDGMNDGWRGDVHIAPWPVEFCGPEYWLFKQEAEKQADGDNGEGPEVL